MKVVSNTSPLLNLAIVRQTIHLENLFGTVSIPLAVQAELATFDPERLQLNQMSNWLEVKPLSSDAMTKALSIELDQGEAEAIALALELDADLILLDELKGRAVARRLGLRCMGILGILAEAKRQGRIIMLKPVLDELISDAGFWLHPLLYQRILTEAHED